MPLLTGCPAARTQPGRAAPGELHRESNKHQHLAPAADKEKGDPEGGAVWERSAGALGGAGGTNAPTTPSSLHAPQEDLQQTVKPEGRSSST